MPRAWYLRELLGTFNNNLDLALAAHNACVVAQGYVR
jgi:soluble lytic murein transglycosylase-like protein